MKKTIKSTVVVCLLFIGSFSINAQPGDPQIPDGGSNPVPISGIGYLLAAGAVFGIKKIYDKKKLGSGIEKIKQR